MQLWYSRARTLQSTSVLPHLRLPLSRSLYALRLALDLVFARHLGIVHATLDLLENFAREARLVAEIIAVGMAFALRPRRGPFF